MSVDTEITVDLPGPIEITVEAPPLIEIGVTEAPVIEVAVSAGPVHEIVVSPPAAHEITVAAPAVHDINVAAPPDVTISLDLPAGPPGPPGLPGPSAVSTDEGNIARLGSDSLIFVPPIPVDTPVIPGSGGIVTSVGGFRIHTFDSTGYFDPGTVTKVDVLIVGGGGGGGSDRGGGGGGGGIIAQTDLTPIEGTVTVGAGGAIGTVGDDSSVFGLTAKGGGKGGTSAQPAGDGGSGGGASGNWDGSSRPGGLPTSGQGFAGGPSNTTGGGGGGGASAVGLATVGSTGNTNSPGGHGGAGKVSDINGASITYAGGGGGGGAGIAIGGNPGSGGAGRGGNGEGNSDRNGFPGLANTGGGGGGGGDNGASGAAGGSGIVIIRYPEPPATPDLPPGGDVGEVLTKVGDEDWAADWRPGPVTPAFSQEFLAVQGRYVYPDQPADPSQRVWIAEEPHVDGELWPNHYYIGHSFTPLTPLKYVTESMEGRIGSRVALEYDGKIEWSYVQDCWFYGDYQILKVVRDPNSSVPYFSERPVRVTIYPVGMLTGQSSYFIYDYVDVDQEFPPGVMAFSPLTLTTGYLVAADRDMQGQMSSWLFGAQVGDAIELYRSTQGPQRVEVLASYDMIQSGDLTVKIGFPESTFDDVPGRSSLVSHVELLGGSTGTPPDETPDFYRHSQPLMASTWTVDHNLGRHPSVAAEDAVGNALYGGVEYLSDDQLRITFKNAITGFANCT